MYPVFWHFSKTLVLLCSVKYTFFSCRLNLILASQMTNNRHILLILIFLVSKTPYPSIVYFIKEPEPLVEPNSHICKTNE